VAAVYAVVEAPAAGWGDPQTLGLLALAAVLTALFVGIEARSKAPLAPLGVFRSRSLVGGNLVLFALGTTAFAVPFILTQYAQEVLHWSPVHFGLASVVMPVTAVAGTATAQAVATRGGVRAVAVVALALTGVGCLLLTHVSVGGSYVGDLLFALVLLGPGVGGAYVAGSIASLAGVADTEAGLASGLNNASFQIGGAVGVAILSTVAVSGAHGPDPLAALTAGYRSAFTAAIAVAVVGMAAAGLLLGRRREPRPAPAAEAAPTTA
jgi:predicted MFS family arabinose efflux permease